MERQPTVCVSLRYTDQLVTFLTNDRQQLPWFRNRKIALQLFQIPGSDNTIQVAPVQFSDTIFLICHQPRVTGRAQNFNYNGFSAAELSECVILDWVYHIATPC